MKELQEIYLGKISEALLRFDACEQFLSVYQTKNEIFVFESAVLQMRKALEAVALAAIAPNKAKYSEYRSQAQKNGDFTKDYNARSILRFLASVNPDFYPRPISPPIPVSPGKWHYERRNDDSLSKSQFERFYDRLGKYLHSDNPWGSSKGVTNLTRDMSTALQATRKLLSWHFTVIRAPEFSGVWVVEAAGQGAAPRIVPGEAEGEFVVN